MLLHYATYVRCCEIRTSVYSQVWNAVKCALIVKVGLILLVAGWSRFSFCSLGGSTLRSWLWRLSEQWRLWLLRL